MDRIQTGYIPPDPRWPMPQSLLDKLTAARPCERDLPASPWAGNTHSGVHRTSLKPVARTA